MQNQTQIVLAYEKIGLEPTTSWKSAVDMVSKIFWLGVRDIEPAFDVIDAIISNARSEPWDTDDEYTTKNVAETIMNERLLYNIKSFMDYNKPNICISALKLLNNWVIYGGMTKAEEEYIVTSKLINEIISLLDISMKGQNIDIIKNAVDWIGTLATLSLYLLKVIQNRSVLPKIAHILSESDDYDIINELPSIWVTLANWWNNLADNFQYQLKDLVPHLLNSISVALGTGKWQKSKTLDLQDLSESWFLMLNQTLWTIYHLTLKYDNYTQLFIQREHFLDQLLRWLFSSSESISVPALRIVWNITIQDFPEVCKWFVEEGVVEKLIKFVHSKDSKIAKDALLGISNIMITDNNTYKVIMEDNRMLDLFISLLDDFQTEIKYEGIMVFSQVLKLQKWEYIDEYLKHKVLKNLVDNLHDLKLSPNVIHASITCINQLFVYFGQINQKIQQDLIDEFAQLDGIDAIEGLLRQPNDEFDDILIKFMSEFYDFNTSGLLETRDNDADHEEYFKEHAYVE